MPTPSVYPIFLKAQSGGGGGPPVEIPAGGGGGGITRMPEPQIIYKDKIIYVDQYDDDEAVLLYMLNLL
jgi:hypothetical protein